MKNHENFEKLNKQNVLQHNTYTAKDEIYKILVDWWFKTEWIVESNSDIKKYLELIYSWKINALSERDGMEALLKVIRAMNPWIEIKGDPTMVWWMLFCNERDKLKLPVWFYIAKSSLRTKHNTRSWIYREYTLADMNDADPEFYELI